MHATTSPPDCSPSTARAKRWPVSSRGSHTTPGDAQLVSKLGTALGDLRRVDEAIDAFRQVVQIRPNDSLSHGNLGLALRKADRHDEAIRSFERAVSFDPASQAITIISDWRWPIADGWTKRWRACGARSNSTPNPRNSGRTSVSRCS
jgi:tetratricopeptide (TPR) repeat protein